MTDRFVGAIKESASRHRIPLVRFNGGERKDDIAKRYLARFEGDEGVVFIGVAPEYGRAFRSTPQRSLKRQLGRADIPFEVLDNGFLSCADPERLQTIRDQLGADDVERLFRRWLARLPHPFTRADRAAGYRYRLSVWQWSTA